MDLLQSVPEHRPIHLLQDVGPNLRHPIGAHPHDVEVICGVMDLELPPVRWTL
jgi:hypothetical protein